ncbi:zinc finger, CCHC-type containing protein, partial [Tanacetum coccineum]
GSQEVQTQDLIYYHLARDREQHSTHELFNYREDSNEFAFAIAEAKKIYANESLTFNNTVAYEVISKWKAGLKDDMDAQSDVYLLSNSCKKCSDDNNVYYSEYTLDLQSQVPYGLGIATNVVEFSIVDYILILHLLADNTDVGGGFRIDGSEQGSSVTCTVGNGVRAQVDAIGSFDLVLLMAFSKIDVLYFNAVPRNGIDEIDMHLTPPYTPQHNGVSERRKRTLLDMVRSMMESYTLPLSFCGLCLEVWGLRLLGERYALKNSNQRSVKFKKSGGRAVDREEIQEEGDNTPSEYHLAQIPHEGGKYGMGPSRSSSGCRTLGAVVFKKKTVKDGIVHVYKARLVAKESMQASRSIYGLKQASRSWNKRFDKEIKRFGFTQNLDEPCVYQKASGSNVTFLILVEILAPGEPHWTAVKNILKYLRNTKDMFLVYSRNPEAEL